VEDFKIRCHDCRFIPEDDSKLPEGWAVLKIELMKDGVLAEHQKRCLCPTCYSNRQQFARHQVHVKF